ncbi:Ku protein [Phenylobacterium sp.]|uniref:non-homologous end joining protein Ku n=1 Tax=Phenylobacterium sp. TaxID=1871053 RepID=UPI002719DC95|nr:Ku protein [Phenylobacterium sp.]MDO8377577.1 Ku protein [Phenylobacterium sp.]
MTARPTWQGHLRLSLVSCPVALYTATSRTGDVSFNMLHKTTHNRIRMVPTDPEIGPVERSDIVKGYEIEKDRYVVVTPEEIDSVRLESTRTIDIDKFVDAEEIDRLYWNDPYFLVPDGKVAVEAFTVIREAMEKAGKIALGRLVMHQRERMLALEPRGKGLVAYTLRTFDEVKAPEDFFEDIPAAKADKDMIAIAAKIIERQEGDFDPREFKDHYEDALRTLIKEKEMGAGRKVTVEEPQGAEVIDLMEALRRSLAGDRGAAKATKPAAKKAAAKHAPTKKRA